MGDHYRAQQFIDAIPGSGGFIVAIAKRVGCAWHTAAKYCTKYSTVAQALQNEREAMLDMVESKAFEQARDNDGQMIRYILSTKGKKRGYTERVEITGAAGEAIHISIDR